MFRRERDAWFKASQGKLSSKDNVALFNEFQRKLDFLPKDLKDEINFTFKALQAKLITEFSLVQDQLNVLLSTC
jgi:hypothetical protein